VLQLPGLIGLAGLSMIDTSPSFHTHRPGELCTNYSVGKNSEFVSFPLKAGPLLTLSGSLLALPSAATQRAPCRSPSALKIKKSRAFLAITLWDEGAALIISGFTLCVLIFDNTTVGPAAGQEHAQVLRAI